MGDVADERSQQTSEGKPNVVDDYDSSMNEADNRLQDIKEELETEGT